MKNMLFDQNGFNFGMHFDFLVFNTSVQFSVDEEEKRSFFLSFCTHSFGHYTLSV